MSKQASQFQEKFMSRLYRGKEIFKPLNTGWIDDKVACVREYVANIFFYTKGGTTIMIDAGYSYERLAEKMSWIDIDPAGIRHILITHQDTDHVGAIEHDADKLFPNATIYVGKTENRYLTGEVRRKVMHGLYALPQVHTDIPKVLVDDNVVFEIDGIKIEALHVPGHTWGHLVYLLDDTYLFTGDTIWLGIDGGYSFISTLAEDNKIAVQSLAKLEQRLRARKLNPLVITGHTGWADDLDFVFAHTDCVVSSARRQDLHDPNAPFDGYDESGDTETAARTIRLQKMNGPASMQAAAARGAGKKPTLAYRTIEMLTRKLDIQAPYRKGESSAIEHLSASNAKKSMPPASLFRRFEVEKRLFGESPVFVFRSRTTEPKRRVLFLHGGGGMMRATHFHYAYLSRLILQTHAEIWMPFYPLAPKAGFFESLDACMSAYQAMEDERKLSPIFFAGDSAGANLELALCRKALDAGLPAPRGIVCISPATGFELPGYHESFLLQTQITRDPMLCVEMVDGIRNHWYATVPLDDPLGNPAYVDYTGFPPVLLFLGTAEIFYPATEAIPARMNAAGVDLRCVRGDALMHDWALLNYYPEGAAAQGIAKRFILEHS